ncbi:ribosomal L1 domain-containing protein CG13096 [Athalia rosae]|uniref:ribosomal L1 domain-containing protein CG13096 n=1 Tax=Athalia rosae TaxID=37344 RepID=UPI002033AE9D|nr:ribosomal L1 domain-containing protein CG13096 [Athalia rosae]
MGKIAKRSKIIPDESGIVPKVKKLVNNPGVSKANSKVNLKGARGPLMKQLENKSDVFENTTFIGNGKVLKAKKNISKQSKKNVNLKPNSQVAPQSITKAHETNPTSENVISTLLSKTKVVMPQAPLRDQNDANIKQILDRKVLKRKSGSESTSKTLEKKKDPPSETSLKKPTVKKLLGIQIKKVQKNKDSKTEITEEKAQLNNQDQNTEHPKNASLDEEQVAKGIAAVLKLAELQTGSKKKLFDEEPQPIFLQVSCIKVPKVPRRQLRILLPNTLVRDNDDVVLFVKDLRKGRITDFEPTIEHYQELLRKNGCTQIKDVIPLTQVKTEFDQFELKRKLLSSYDYFLTEGKIAGHLSHLLGKNFINRRKLPTSIKLDSENLKEVIDIALRKTIMPLHSNGSSHIVQVAHTAMKPDDIASNVVRTCKTLAHEYPGGWSNIRTLILKTPSSLAVPIYVTLKSKNKVKVPVIIPKRPNAHRIVTGELSTVPGHVGVIVKPDGTVTTFKTKKEHAENADQPSAKKVKLNNLGTKKTKRNKKNSAASGGVDKDLGVTETSERSSAPKNQDTEKSKLTERKNSEGSEDEIEAAERAYLSQLHEESVTTTYTREKSLAKKKSNIVKKIKSKA